MPKYVIVTVTAICQRHPQTGMFSANVRPHSLKARADEGWLMLDCPTCGRGYTRNPETGEWFSDRKLTVISETKALR